MPKPRKIDRGFVPKPVNWQALATQERYGTIAKKPRISCRFSYGIAAETDSKHIKHSVEPEIGCLMPVLGVWFRSGPTLVCRGCPGGPAWKCNRTGSEIWLGRGSRRRLVDFTKMSWAEAPAIVGFCDPSLGQIEPNLRESVGRFNIRLCCSRQYRTVSIAMNLDETV